MSHPITANGASRFAGQTLIAASLLSAFAILHHPTSHGDTATQRIESMARMQSFNGLIHGGLIAMLLLIWLALDALSVQRGMDRARIRCAGRLYALGTGAMVGAALINGFVATSLAQGALAHGTAAAEATASLLHLCWAANQTLAGFGLVLQSAAIALWSSDLRSGPTRIARVTGVYGLLTALGCIAAFALGALRLDVAGMIVVVFAQAIWYALVGIGLIRSTR